MRVLFTAAEWATVRQRRHLQQAHLVLPSETLKDPRDRRYIVRARREVVVHDEDGNITGKRRELVGEDGILTVLLVEDVDVTGEKSARDALRVLTHADATACGHKTLGTLREAWRARHRQAEFGKLVWFAVGDWRDRDVYLNWTGGVGGDYTSNSSRAIDRDAPCVTGAELERMSRGSRTVADLRVRYEIVEARDEVERAIRTLRFAVGSNDEIETSVRRLERELWVLDRKLSVS